MDEGAELTSAFIAYRSTDSVYAEKVERYLNQKGIRTWRDKTDILPSSVWRGEIDNALRLHARVMVLLWSKDAARSPEVQAEWNMMIRLGRPIFIVRLDDTEVNYRLAEFQCLPRDELEKMLPELAKALRPIFSGYTWLDTFPFLSEVERQFVDLFNYLDIRWFYDPYPSGSFTEYEQPRFWLEKFENLHGLEVLTCKFQAASVLDKQTQQDISQLSSEDLVLVGVLANKVNMVDALEQGKAFPAEIWYVRLGEWRKTTIQQCQACYSWHLADARRFSRRDADDWEGLEIYEAWCPVCKIACERCEQITSRALVIGGLCPSCQEVLGKWMED